MLIEAVGELNGSFYQAMILEQVRSILPVFMTMYNLLIGPKGINPNVDLSNLNSWRHYPLDTEGLPEQDFGNWRE